ncbi:MAG TPA: DUF4097 family beta strand repeat-containing protein [Candidatus Baltobacteraceae bacterium]|nr:DUF4097 family beta strand repeat-containing protein [Candidatus Baltobacteraceae bacterium]
MILAAVAAIVLPLAGATQINMQIESGGVHLIAAAGVRTVTIRSTARGNAAPPRVEVTRNGKAMAIVLTGHSGASVPFAQGAAGSVGYEIVYPANVRIEASELSGDITLDGEQTRAALETNAGSIYVNNARGELDLAAGDGDITVTLAKGWKAPSLRMQSANGTLRLSVPPSFRAHIDAQADIGSVHDSLARAAANRPFVWLYSERGDIFIQR